jgi:hypothetical protein
MSAKSKIAASQALEMPAESLAEGKVMAERRSPFSSFSFGGDRTLDPKSGFMGDRAVLRIKSCKICFERHMRLIAY